MSIQVVILAAGLGKRMFSDTPKMLHLLGSKPLLAHVIDTATQLSSGVPPIVVYGHQGTKVREALSGLPVHWVEQREQSGTGHALQQALPEITDNASVLVLSGDVPLITVETLQRLMSETPKNAIGMITAYIADPTGYGRIQRSSNLDVVGIVEEKDATAEERTIHEINTGIYFVPATYLKKWLPALKNKNAQSEYYLTDIITHAVNEKIPVHTVQPAKVEEIFGVNDRVQLAQLERFYQFRQAEKLMRQGVTFRDPSRVDFRGEVQIGRDVTIDINVIFEGHVIIGDHCVIGPNTVLKYVVLGDRVEIKANSVVEGAEIGADCVVGPFARIRPGTMLAQHAHIGNFVEVKNSRVGDYTKINHLSYVGDSEIGKRVNVGAGTITCNYDGANKHKTTIHDDAFIGSGTQLVAPVTVGEGATIGAGSTITRDASPHVLTLSRVEQSLVKDWVRPAKKEKIKDQ